MIEFRHPFILYIYLPLLFIWVMLAIKNRNNKLLINIDSDLREKLLINIDANRYRWKQRLFFLSTLLLIFASYGPQIGTRLAPLDRKGIDLVFAIDVSTSRNAEDIKRNRVGKD
jgi:hypothetical protein